MNMFGITEVLEMLNILMHFLTRPCSLALHEATKIVICWVEEMGDKCGKQIFDSRCTDGPVP